jgi:hypothetical protein
MSGRPVPIIDIPKVSQPQEDCSWCWYALHPLIPFPSDRSSTCCPEHCVWVVSGRARKREERQRKEEQR